MADDLANQISQLTIDTDKHPTGIVYDELMTKHKCDYMHPECPERILKIHEALTKEGLIKRCTIVTSREATSKELLTVHTQEHVEAMEKTASMTPEKLKIIGNRFSSIYLNEFSYQCALLSAGSVIELTHQVVKGLIPNGIAIVRPPGHHAIPNKPMGFCLFNNVSIAAYLANNEWGTQKVVILDWDVHHGNGTQQMFEKESNVLYISFHRYMCGCFYPSSKEGSHTYIGVGKGVGYNVNIPWDHHNVSDGDVMAAFHFIILPIISEYSPDLILVSSGFDAAVGDPLGGCQLTPELFGNMTHLLKTYANGKIVLALEGGYNLTSISDAAVQCVKALLGDAPPTLPPMKPCRNAVGTIVNTIDAISPYWECLKYLKDIFKSTIEMPTPSKVKSTPKENDNSKLNTPTTTPTTNTTRPTTRSASKDKKNGASDLAAPITSIESSVDRRLESIASAASAQVPTNMNVL